MTALPAQPDSARSPAPVKPRPALASSRPKRSVGPPPRVRVVALVPRRVIAMVASCSRHRDTGCVRDRCTGPEAGRMRREEQEALEDLDRIQVAAVPRGNAEASA